MYHYIFINNIPGYLLSSARCTAPTLMTPGEFAGGWPQNGPSL